MNNPSVNAMTLTVDVQISVPSGIHVHGEGFGYGGAAAETISSTTIDYMHITSNVSNSYAITTVEEKLSNPHDTAAEEDIANPSEAEPGFSAILSIAGLITVAYLIHRW